MKKPFKAFMSCVLLVVLFLSVQVIGAFILSFGYAFKQAMAGVQPLPEDVTAYIVSKVNLMVIINYTVLPLITVILFAIRKVKVREYIKTAKLDLKMIPMIVCFALATQLVSGLLITGLNMIVSTQSGMEAMQDAIQSDNIVLGFIALAIFAPVVEEFFFRGVIFTKLKNHMNVKVALFIQAAFFSFVHLNLAQMLPTLLLGIVTGILYLKYKDIKVPILLHMVYNTYAVIVGNLPESAYAVCGLVLIMATIGSVIILLSKRGEKVTEEDIDAVS